MIRSFGTTTRVTSASAPWPTTGARKRSCASVVPFGTYGEWFEGGYDKQAPEGLGSLRFFLSRDILEKSDTPLAALRHFLAEREAEAKAGDEDGQMSLW